MFLRQVPFISKPLPSNQIPSFLRSSTTTLSAYATNTTLNDGWEHGPSCCRPPCYICRSVNVFPQQFPTQNYDEHTNSLSSTVSSKFIGKHSETNLSQHFPETYVCPAVSEEETTTLTNQDDDYDVFDGEKPNPWAVKQTDRRAVFEVRTRKGRREKSAITCRVFLLIHWRLFLTTKREGTEINFRNKI